MEKIETGKIVKIETVMNWAANPRVIEKDEYQLLTTILKKRGQTQPLLINTGKKFGTAGEVISGNMRLRVMNDLGWKEVWVKEVSPVDEKDLIEMAVENNGSFGYWEKEQLAELSTKYAGDEYFASLKISLAHEVGMDSFLQSFGPGQQTTPEVLQDKAKEMNVDEYNNAAIKQLVFFFSSKEYNEVIKKSDAIKKAEEIKNNSELFLFLLDLYNEKS